MPLIGAVAWIYRVTRTNYISYTSMVTYIFFVPDFGSLYQGIIILTAAYFKIISKGILEIFCFMQIICFSTDFSIMS